MPRVKAISPILRVRTLPHSNSHREDWYQANKATSWSDHQCNPSTSVNSNCNRFSLTTWTSSPTTSPIRAPSRLHCPSMESSKANHWPRASPWTLKSLTTLPIIDQRPAKLIQIVSLPTGIVNWSKATWSPIVCRQTLCALWPAWETSRRAKDLWTMDLSRVWDHRVCFHPKAWATNSKWNGH